MSEQKPVFKINKELRTGALPAMRVTSEMEDAVKAIAGQHNLAIHEVIRQMIQFALDHMEAK